MKTTLWRTLTGLLASLMFHGCYQMQSVSDAPWDGSADADTDTDVDGDADTDADADTDTDGFVSCEDALDNLNDAISATYATSVVVRVSYDTKEILGYQLMPGEINYTDEEAAKLTAQDDTGIEVNTVLNQSDEDFTWLLYRYPGDFGGAVVVHQLTGVTLFGATVNWMGPGEIVFPSAWLSVQGLGSDCAPVESDGESTWGYDLNSTEVLGEEEIDEAIEAIEHTAIPSATNDPNNYFLGYNVLLYSEDPDASPPEKELIIIVNLAPEVTQPGGNK